MCYKQELYKGIMENLKAKIDDMPLFIQDYFLENKKSAKTNNCYWGYIRDLLCWLIKNGYIEKESINDITPEDLDTIKPMDIRKYLSDLENGVGCKKNCKNSLATKQNVFRGFWTYLEDNDYVRKNIMRRVKDYHPKETDRENISVPTDKEFEEFLNEIEKESDDFLRLRNKAIVYLLSSSGIRISELMGLDLSDVYMDGSRCVDVMRKGNYEIQEKAAMSINAYNHLMKYVEKRNEFLEVNKIQSPALFISKKGGRLGKTAIDHFFEKCSHNKIHCHMLRHYCGTYIADNNPVEVVADLLGHKDPKTSFRYYVKKDIKKMGSVVANM